MQKDMLCYNEKVYMYEILCVVYDLNCGLHYHVMNYFTAPCYGMLGVVYMYSKKSVKESMNFYYYLLTSLLCDLFNYKFIKLL
jgi:hypothetical protein